MPPQQIGGNFSFPPRPHLGENFHFIGHSNNQSPPSPAPPPYTTGTPTENDSIELDDGGGAGGVASRQVKKRFWTHDEEVKLVITQLPWFTYNLFKLDLMIDQFVNSFFFVGKCLAEHF